jgi:hypothetical protein
MQSAVNERQATLAVAYFDVRTREAQGAGDEGAYVIGQFPWIRPLFAHQDADQHLANSAYHQCDGEMRINIIGNNAVTLGHLEHERTRGELLVGEGYLDIQDFRIQNFRIRNFRRAAQCPDAKAKRWSQ